MHRSTAEIIREYGPFPGVDHVHGVTYDGERIWFAAGDTLQALDPASGKTLRKIDVAADAGTAFDGEHLFQIAEDRIQKIDPKTGRVLATIPAPGGGADWLQPDGVLLNPYFGSEMLRCGEKVAEYGPDGSQPSKQPAQRDANHAAKVEG